VRRVAQQRLDRANDVGSQLGHPDALEVPVLLQQILHGERPALRLGQDHPDRALDVRPFVSLGHMLEVGEPRRASGVDVELRLAAPGQVVLIGGVHLLHGVHAEVVPGAIRLELPREAAAAAAPRFGLEPL